MAGGFEVLPVNTRSHMAHCEISSDIFINLEEIVQANF